MEHLKALGIKWIFTTIILLSLLAIFDGITISQILIISLVVTGVTYIIGDLMVLPTFGNLVTTIVDFGLILLSVWMLTSLYIEQTAAVVLISAAVAYFFAFCEALFHAYMKEKVLPKKKGVVIPFPKMGLQTEFSKEIHPEKDKKE